MKEASKKVEREAYETPVLDQRGNLKKITLTSFTPPPPPER